MKVYRGVIPLILNLGIRWRKEPLASIEQEAGWATEQSGHFGEEKNLLYLPGIELP
jgi:hypothetical protein